MERWRRISGMITFYKYAVYLNRTWLFSSHKWQKLVGKLNHAFKCVLWYCDPSVSVLFSFSFCLQSKTQQVKVWNMKPSCLAFCSLFLPHHFLLFEVMLFVPLHLYMSNLTCSSQFISNVASFLICLCINPLHIAHCRDLISISWSTWIEEWVKAGVYYIRWFKEAAFSLQLHPHWYCAFKTKN